MGRMARWPSPAGSQPSTRRTCDGSSSSAAVVGLLLGIETVVLHLTTDPLADVHAYYDAGARLNAGQPLYDQPATTDESDFYRYPPLLAILFRPLATAVVRGGRGDLDGRAGRLLRADDPSARARRRSTWLVAGDARAADGLEPRRSARPRSSSRCSRRSGRRGRSRWRRTSRCSRRCSRSGGSAGATVRPLGVVRRLGRRALIAVQFVLAPQASIDFVRTFGLGQVGERREPLALRPLADPLGGGRRRRDRRRVAARAVALGLGGRGRVVGVRDAAAADLPAVDARRRRPRSIRRLDRRPVRGAVRRAGRRPDVARRRREAPEPGRAGPRRRRLARARLARLDDVHGVAADRRVRPRARAPGRTRRGRGPVAVRRVDGRRRGAGLDGPLLLVPAAGRPVLQPVRRRAERRDARRAVDPARSRGWRPRPSSSRGGSGRIGPPRRSRCRSSPSRRCSCRTRWRCCSGTSIRSSRSRTVSCSSPRSPSRPSAVPRGVPASPVARRSRWRRS